MESLEERRAAEVAKYVKAYQFPVYRLGEDRGLIVKELLCERPDLRASYLDVGCGRGESLEIAKKIGYGLVVGVDVVEVAPDGLVVIKAPAWNLPFEDNGYETVTCFDVMEHLLPEDAELAVREMARVAERRLVITISNLEDIFGKFLGVGHLHINRRPYEAWAVDLERWLRE